MTTYADAETGIATGAPVELYRFQLQGQVWTYTSADTAQDYNLETYLPVPITRTEPVQDKEPRAQSLKITLPLDDQVALLFQQGAPAGYVALTIYRFHRGISQVIPFWVGRIRGCLWQAGHAELDAEPIYAMLQRDALRFQFQRPCNHMLYGPDCRLSRGDWATVATLSDVTGLTITSAAFAAKADGWFKAGLVSWGYQKRMVTAHTGAVLTLLTPFEGLVAGITVTAYAGCDRTLAICSSRFGNQLNFGGFPYVPGINPFNGVL